jgi:hypothetical protein
MDDDSLVHTHSLAHIAVFVALKHAQSIRADISIILAYAHTIVILYDKKQQTLQEQRNLVHILQSQAVINMCILQWLINTQKLSSNQSLV